MKRIQAVAFAAATLGVAQVAQAAGIGVRAGTTGVGGDIGFGLLPTLSARLGYSALSFSRDIDVTDVQYDGDLKLSNFSALLDFSPLPGPFRVTGGFIFNDNKVDVTGRPSNGSYTLNGTTYPAAAVGNLAGTVKSGNRAAPYLGIGYGNVAGFVKRESKAETGAGEGGRIVDSEGRTLGAHPGIEGFTVGQRRGIGVPGPLPRYVLRVLPESREIVVGDPEPEVKPPPTPTTPTPAPTRTGPTGIVVVKTVPPAAVVREKGKGVLEKSGAGYVLSIGSHTLLIESPDGESTPPIPVVVKKDQTVEICYDFSTNKRCASQ